MSDSGHSASGIEQCPKCMGYGVRFIRTRCLGGSVECERCDGTGEIRYIDTETSQENTDEQSK